MCISSSNSNRLCGLVSLLWIYALILKTAIKEDEEGRGQLKPPPLLRFLRNHPFSFRYSCNTDIFRSFSRLRRKIQPVWKPAYQDSSTGESAYIGSQSGSIARQSAVNLLLLPPIRFGKLPCSSFAAGGSPTGRLYERDSSGYILVSSNII